MRTLPPVTHLKLPSTGPKRLVTSIILTDERRMDHVWITTGAITMSTQGVWTTVSAHAKKHVDVDHRSIDLFRLTVSGLTFELARNGTMWFVGVLSSDPEDFLIPLGTPQPVAYCEGGPYCRSKGQKAHHVYDASPEENPTAFEQFHGRPVKIIVGWE